MNFILYFSFFLNIALLIAVIFFIWQTGRMKQVAHFDYLTGLLNKRGLDFFLKKFLGPRAKIGLEYRMTICYLDLNNFKKVNDKYGHYKGDILLNSIGKIFNESLRDEDIACRLGGDEFLLVFFNGKDKIDFQYAPVMDKIEKIYEKVLRKNRLLKMIAGSGGQLFARGCIRLKENIKSLEEFYSAVNMAEEKMRKNKKGGR